jgi:hypothetical protein
VSAVLGTGTSARERSRVTVRGLSMDAFRWWDRCSAEHYEIPNTRPLTHIGPCAYPDARTTRISLYSPLFHTQATLVFDQDIDDGITTEPHLLTTHRSDEHGVPPIISDHYSKSKDEAVSIAQNHILLHCKFSFKPGILATLRVRDVRLSVEVIAVDAGDGSMAKARGATHPVL